MAKIKFMFKTKIKQGNAVSIWTMPPPQCCGSAVLAEGCCLETKLYKVFTGAASIMRAGSVFGTKPSFETTPRKSAD